MQAIHKIHGKTRELAFPIASISLIVIAVLIFYGQDLSIIANEAFQSEATNYILIVPILVSFLIFRKRNLVKASFALERLGSKTALISFSEITGIALCLSAFLTYWYGSYTFYPLEYHMVSLVIFSLGMTLTLFNVRTLISLLFPIMFLIFLAPPPSWLISSAGTLLGSVNAQATYTLLRTLGLPVALTWDYGPPTLLLNSSSGQSLQFAVDQACSGVYSLIAFTMFATFLVYILRGSIGKRIALIPLGFLMLPILNTVRISTIVLIADKFGQQIAMEIFHTFSGWVLLSLGMVLIILFAEKLLHLQIYRNNDSIESCPRCADTRKNYHMFCSNCGRLTKNNKVKLEKRFWIKISALLIASYIAALSIHAPVFASAQGLTLTSANPETNTSIFPQASDYNLTYLYRDYNLERISRQDASLLYAYLPQNASNPTIYIMIGVSSSIGNLHSWEGCFVSWPITQGYSPTVNVLDSRDTQMMENPPITAQYFTFQYPSDKSTMANYTQVTLYWFQRVLFRSASTVESKYTRISLIILTRNRSDYLRLEEKLLYIGQSIAVYWEPLKSQTLISLGIPAMQVSLGSTAVLAGLIQATQYTDRWKKKMVNAKIFERLGSPEEKLLYQTIKKLRQKTKETTTQNILSAFEKNPNNAKSNCPAELLNSLKKNGVIEADLMVIHDQPIQIWKP